MNGAGEEGSGEGNGGGGGGMKTYETSAFFVRNEAGSGEGNGIRKEFCFFGGKFGSQLSRLQPMGSLLERTDELTLPFASFVSRNRRRTRFYLFETAESTGMGGGCVEIC